MANGGLLSFRHVEIFWHMKEEFRNTKRSWMFLMHVFLSVSKHFQVSDKQLKHRKTCIVQVIEHSMTSLSFQTAIQKNKAKLSSFVQFEKEMVSYLAV